MSITAVVTASFIGADTRVAGTTANVPIPFNLGGAVDFSNGTAANQANVVWQDPITFSGTTYTLNVGSGGGLVDEWGTAVAAARIKGAFIANTGNASFTVGGGTDAVANFLQCQLPPGAFVLIASPDANGWPVTASTACDINFSGATSGQTFQAGLLLANA